MIIIKYFTINNENFYDDEKISENLNGSERNWLRKSVYHCNYPPVPRITQFIDAEHTADIIEFQANNRINFGMSRTKIFSTHSK